MLWQSILLSVLVPFLHQLNPESLSHIPCLALATGSNTTLLPTKATEFPSQVPTSQVPKVLMDDTIIIKVSAGKPFRVVLPLKKHFSIEISSFTFLSALDWVDGFKDSTNDTYILGGNAPIVPQKVALNVFAHSQQGPIGFTLSLESEEVPYEAIYCNEECTDQYRRYSSKDLAINETLGIILKAFFYFSLSFIVLLGIPIFILSVKVFNSDYK